VEWILPVLGVVIAALLGWLIVTIKKGIHDFIMKADKKMEEWFGDETANKIEEKLAEAAQQIADSLKEAKETDSFQGDKD